MRERGSEVAVEDVLAAPDAVGKAARGGAIRIVGYLLGVAMLFVSVPLLTRHLGVVGFGSYVSVLALTSIVALVADAGLTVVGVREYAIRSPEDRSRLIANILALRLLIAASGALLAVGFSVVAGYEPPLIAGTALAGLGAVLFSIHQTYTIPLAADLRLGRVTVLELLRQALTVGGMLVLIAAGAGVTAFLAVPVPVGIVLVVVTAMAIRHVGKLWPGFDSGERQPLLRATIPVAAASVLAALFYKIAVVMMSVLSGDEEIGYFSASLRIVEVIVPIASLITSAAFPLLSRAASNDAHRFNTGMQRLFEVGCILGAATVVVLVVGAEPIMQFVGGDEFDPAVPVLQIQGIAMAGSFLFAVWAAGLLAVGAQRSLVVATVVGVGSVVALTATLAPAYGAIGAAVAMTLSGALTAGVTGVLLMRRPDLRVEVAIVPRVVVALTCGLLISLIDLPPVVVVLLAIVAYIVVLTLLGGVPREIRHLFLYRWRALRGGQL